MDERLLEGWLDSAGERTYQGPFCQALSSQGYTVLHSTRHAPIEFGKDVIALGPDGTPCAYQLKGNPGSRLTLIQFREIQEQLFQLATQAIVLPGISNVPHRCFLVTNGQVDEEVARSVDDMNRTLARSGLNPIEIIARGQLLAMFKREVGDYWPTEIPDLHRVFRLLALRGDEQPPFELLHEVLSQVLRLDAPDAIGREDLRRRVASAAVVLAICLRSFSQKENHFVVLSAWVLFATYVIAACARHGHSFNAIGAASVDMAMATVTVRLSALASEVVEREHHFEGHPFEDAVVSSGRRTLLTGLLSAFWLWCRRGECWPLSDMQSTIESGIAKARKGMELWGEGALPHYLAYAWYFRATDPSLAPDAFMISILQASIGRPKPEGSATSLASPYYSFEDVRRHQLAKIWGRTDPMEDDSRDGSSYFAEAVFDLLARAGLKSSCKDLWPGLTRLTHCSFIPDSPWQFGVWRSGLGTNFERLLPFEETWANVVEQARFVGTPEVPLALRDRPELLLMYCLLFPFRATPNVVRYLGRCFSETWFIPPPREDAPLGPAT